MRAPRIHRRRFLWPVVAGLAPAAGNVVSVWLLPHGRSVDLTSVCFAVTAGVCWWALQHSALPDVLPVAFSHVVETIDDAVLVVDRRHRIVQLNPAADALLRKAAPSAPGQPVGARLEEFAGPLEPRFHDSEREQQTFTIPGAGLDVDLRTAPLTDARGECIGWVLVARDVTEELRRRAEAASANEALREQLELVERLRAELAEQAARDPLTGLHNRRRMVEFLARDAPTALAAGLPVSLLMLDVDWFKRVNDEHGHAVGDAVLVAVAAALAEDVREGELLARFGGEEFVVVLPGCALPEAVRRAERWRLRCAGVVVPGAGGRPVRTTVSVGVAALHGGAEGVAALQGGEGTDALLAAADAALYAAKAAGRDRVATAEVCATRGAPARR